MKLCLVLSVFILNGSFSSDSATTVNVPSQAQAEGAAAVTDPRGGHTEWALSQAEAEGAATAWALSQAEAEGAAATLSQTGGNAAVTLGRTGGNGGQAHSQAEAESATPTPGHPAAGIHKTLHSTIGTQRNYCNNNKDINTLSDTLQLAKAIAAVAAGGAARTNKSTQNSRSSKESSIEYLTRPQSHITIPIMVHFDKSLTDKLIKEHKIRTRKKLKDMSRIIFRQVETNFRLPGLNQSIYFWVLDTKFIRKRDVDENSSEYLKNYCVGQAQRKRQSRRWWYSILLTGVDLFYLDKNGKEVRRRRGYMGGLCALEKSCTILEWNPKNIGYLLTHELGHSLGMTHDGTPHNECKPHRFIMTNKYHPRYQPRTWSSCSKRDLHRFLGSRKAWCIKKYSEFEKL